MLKFLVKFDLKNKIRRTVHPFYVLKNSYACICDKGLTLNATDIAKNKSISNCKEKNTFKTNCRKPKKVGKFPVSCMRNSDGRGRPCKIQMYQFHNEYLLKYASVSDKKKKILDRRMSCNKGNLGHMHVYILYFYPCHPASCISILIL